MKLILTCITYLITFFLIETSFSQTYRFLHFNKERDGLSSELIKAISLDKEGNIWMASDDGVIRYDGLAFKQFIKELPSQYVKSVFQDSKGQLWLSTDMGVLKVLNPNDEMPIFEMVWEGTYNQVDSMLWFPKHFYEDQQERLWFSDNQDVYFMKGELKKKFDLSTENNTNNWQRSYSFFEIYNQTYTVSQTGNLYVLDEPSMQLMPVPMNIDIGKVIAAEVLDKKTVIMVGEKGGFELVFQKEKPFLTSIKQIFDNPYFNYLVKIDDHHLLASTWINGVQSITRLKEGNYFIKRLDGFEFNNSNFVLKSDNETVWIASDHGLTMMQRKMIVNDFPNAPHRYIQHISFDQKNNQQWVSSGKTLFKVGDDEQYTFHQQLAYEVDIIRVLADGENLYLGLNNGVIDYYHEGKHLQKFDFSMYGGGIFNLFKDQKGNVWGCQGGNNGIIKIDSLGNSKVYSSRQGIVSQPFVVKEDLLGNIWVGGLGDQSFLYQYDQEQDVFINKSVQFSIDKNLELDIIDMAFDQEGDLYLATSFGLFYYRDGADFMERKYLGEHTKTAIKAIVIGKDNSLWLAVGAGLLRYYQHNFYLFDESEGLPSKTINFRGLSISPKGNIWVGTVAGAALIGDITEPKKTKTPIFVRKENNGKPITLSSEITFSTESFFNFHFISKVYPQQQVLYQYKLEGVDSIWKIPEGKNKILLSNLEPGEYDLKIKALKKGNYDWSETLSMPIKTQKPFQSSWWFWTLWIMGGFAFTVLMIRLRTNKLKFDKAQLENLVEARTKEVESQSLEMRSTYKKVSESINAALRIQNAILQFYKSPTELSMDHFILWKPKDVVSGDFYWFKKLYDEDGLPTRFVIAAADCTGHGIPGAFMSIMGVTLLNEISRNTEELSAAQMLDDLRYRLKNSFGNQNKGRRTAEGMDISLCIIDYKYNLLEYAGAYNPLYLVRSNAQPNLIEENMLPTQKVRVIQKDDFSLFQVKADSQPIGFFKKEVQFSSYYMKIHKGDAIYLFSDGYTDQFGGEHGQKFKASNFRDLLLGVQEYNMEQQKRLLENKLDNWMGNKYEQLDDILVMGIRV